MFQQTEKMYAKRKCCAVHCVNNNLVSIMHSFPGIYRKVNGHDCVITDKIIRCRQWVKHSGNKKLLAINPALLQKKFYLCSDHFTSSQFILNSSVLRKSSTPSVFSCEPIPEYLMVNYDLKWNIRRTITEPVKEPKLCCSAESSTDKSAGASISKEVSMAQSNETSESVHILPGQCSLQLVSEPHIGEEERCTVRSCSVSSSESMHELRASNIRRSDNVKGMKVWAKRKCCAANCVNNNLVSIMHSFPGICSKVNGHDCVIADKMNRCREWVRQSGNRELLSVNPAVLQSKFYLCNDHFTSSQFNTKSTSILKRNSLPSLFSCEPIPEDLMAIYDCKWNTRMTFTESPEGAGKSYIEDRGATNTSEESETVQSEKNSEEILHEGRNNLGKRCSQLSESDTGIEERCAVQSCKVSNTESSRSRGVQRIRNTCCVPGCRNTNIENPMFHFPKVLSLDEGQISLDEEAFERFLKWVIACGNKHIFQVDPDSVYKKYFVCSDHFDSSSFANILKNRLKRHAVPVNFSESPLSPEIVENYKKSVKDWKDKSFPKMSFDIERTCATSFEEDVKCLDWRTCERCKEKFLSRNDNVKCLHHSKCWEYSDINNMDPGTVPPELEGLSFIEEQLIARIHPLVSVFKLKRHQLGYRGNVINFSQDIQEFAKELPCKAKDLTSVICVRYENSNDKFHDFHVRSTKIRSALKWLQKNNPFYKDIIISEDNLKEFPYDGDIFDQVNSIHLHDSQVDDMSEETEQVDDDVSELQENSVHHSCIPHAYFPHQDNQVRMSLKWPNLGSEPVDEFHTPGYMACAFPTLYPYGKADYRDSRTKQVNPSNYFKHMLRYCDDRFAKHRTFRFFAYNTWMRWTALTDGNIFVKANKEFRNVTAEKLKDMINEKPSLIKKIMFQASNLRGTKAFWHARANELRDMVSQLGLPTIFLTLSCADNHWMDLFRLLSGQDELSSLTEKDRRNLVQENPHIVDMFFDYRVKAFIKHVLMKKFQVVDYWYRIEYQHRGSPHLHGIFWIEGAPNVSNIENESAEKLEEILHYFSELVSAVNPNPDCVQPSVHPCRISYENVQNVEEDLAQLLHTVQRHTKCSTEYCIKWNNKSRKRQCRFNFPIDMQEEASLEKSETGEIEFKPARNDPLLNKFNKLIIQLWRANIDIAPVISKKALLSYLAKYISKCEVSSNALDELLLNIIDKLNDTDSAKKAIQRLFIKSCAERDISAQEVCHTLLSLKLYSSGGRKFVTVNFKSGDWVIVSPSEDGDDHEKHGQSFIEKYKDRPENVEHVSLWTAATTYNVPKWSKVQRQNIIRIFPRIKFNTNETCNEAYYKQQVLLHHPWRNEDTLKKEEDTWEKFYFQCKINDNIGNVTFLGTGEQNDADDTFEIDNNSASEHDEEWMILSRLGPNTDVPDIELGRREEDIHYNWGDAYRKYEVYGSLPEFQCFIDKLKEKEEIDIVRNDVPQVKFSDEQMNVISLINSQIRQIKSATQSNTLDIIKRVIIQGKAGTGKSLLIKYITSTLEGQLGIESYVLATPTGVSAILINGKTLHSVFHIPKHRKDFKPLKGEGARLFSTMFENVKFLILDEYSMIGCETLGMIDLRCKEALGNHNEDFGGLHVYLLGDIKQLPPVKDYAFYSNNQKSVLGKHGKIIFNNFQRAFIMKTCHRQQDTDFVKVLDNISDGQLSVSDYDLLSARFLQNIPSDEESRFSDAIRLFSTKEEVKEYNMKKLSELINPDTGAPLPVARIPAKHNCSTARKGTSDDAEGLEAVIYLAKGCQIMLRNNIWVTKGLVNGAIGVVVDILYNNDNEPPHGRPSVILCQFQTYTGPGILPNTNIIPIKPILKSWTSSSNETCSRYQFPITLCYACSIHKSQGMTLQKAVVNIGHKEFALGLTYVALSRVRSLNSLVIYPFTLNRLSKLKDSQAMQGRKDLLDHLSSIA